MIKSEFQYKVSQDWVEKFKKSIAAMDRDEEAKQKDFLKWDAGRGSLVCHIEQLEAEIAEYEILMRGDKSEPIDIVVENLNKLPDALIKARIAAKMSEKDLAEIIDMDEERIKECEKQDYQCASFGEILEIAFALGLEFKVAVMQVNFEQIEERKKVVERWRNRKMKKASQIS
jgi:DNA-binding XRE family transcriptional regulator